MSIANKTRAEIPFPEAGEGAFLRFTVDSLERLGSEYGDDYLDIVVAKLAKGNIKTYRDCIGVALTEGDVNGFPWGVPLEVINERIVDAVFLTVYGRDRKEQENEEGKRVAEMIEEARTNPLVRGRLSSMLSIPLDMVPDSLPPNSDTSPVTKSSSTPSDEGASKPSD